MEKITRILILAIALVTSNAFAQDNLCKNELINICKSPSAEINNITIKCLYDQKKNLSRACHKQLPTLAQSVGACLLETIAYCSAGKAPRDHLQDVLCLEKNRSKALPACKAKLDEIRANGKEKFDDILEKLAKACPTEYAECGNPKDPKAGACVTTKFKANKVTPNCRQAIMEIAAPKK